ncbi:thioredoxin-like protein, partial [Obelidium mucronatum]
MLSQFAKRLFSNHRNTRNISNRLLISPYHTMQQQWAPKEIVEAGIAGNKVIVFSKSYCPYCVKAKKLLSSYQAVFEVLELDQRDDGDAIQAYLAQKTGQRTVPNIFIGGNQIGGCDALHALDAQGKLKPLL